MAKTANRDKIVQEGLRLVHRRGFGAASVRDIVAAAGVPQGSFTNNFASKDVFGLEILERYHAFTVATLDATLRNDERPPLERLRAWLGEQLYYLKKADMRPGCLYGNLAAEVSEDHDELRAALTRMLGENVDAVAYCLKAAVKAGELSSRTDVALVAGFVISSLQGAILLSKTERDPAAFERFERVLFETVLRR